MVDAPLPPFNDWPNDTGFDVIHEERVPVELKISGTIPNYVSGTLYRTGPGGYQVKTDEDTTFSLNHWFDGFSQNHRFQIIQTDSSTRVTYNSRHSVDAIIEHIRRTGNVPSDYGFAQTFDPCDSIFKNVMSNYVPTPRAPELLNIGVTISVNPAGFSNIHTGKEQNKKRGHASGIQSLWTKTDAVVFREVEPETLEPMGVVSQKSLHPELTGNRSAAHARSDPVTGDVFNYNLTIGEISSYRIFHVSAETEETEILATITDAPPAYLHSLLITENFVILCVWGARHKLKPVWTNVIDAIAPFDPSEKTLWYVVDRKHGKGVVAKYESDAFFCFHTINAWEEASPSDPSQIDIIVDLSAYQNLDIFQRLYYKNLKSTSPGSLEYANRKGCEVFLRRWRLPDVNNTIVSEPREAVTVFIAEPDRSCEMPFINPRFLTKPSRYIYGINDRGLSTFYDCLVKYDT